MISTGKALYPLRIYICHAGDMRRFDGQNATSMNIGNPACADDADIQIALSHLKPLKTYRINSPPPTGIHWPVM